MYKNSEITSYRIGSVERIVRSIVKINCWIHLPSAFFFGGGLVKLQDRRISNGQNKGWNHRDRFYWPNTY
jgi:hypothetical protein